MTPSTSSPSSCATPPPPPAATWPPDHGAPPLFATPRDRTYLSDGALVAAIARALGTPLLPWQQYVADVATEHKLTAEGTREYHHKTVVVSVPRQCGKTTLIHALGVYRAMVLGSDVFYTAQTGKDARARWGDLVKALRKSPTFRQRLKDERIKVALRGGSEHVLFENGHVYQAFAPTEGSLHGYTPPTVFLDEVFYHTPTKGEMLMGAVSPAQQTVRARQLYLVSTKGHAGSTFFHDWIDRATTGTPGVAGFIWGAADHHNPYALDDIPKYHPGVGMFLNDGILTAADVLAEADRNTRAEYERAFANRSTVTLSHLIAADDWRQLRVDTLPPLPEQLEGVTLSYDVAADRTAATLIVTWTDAGRKVAQVLAAAPGLGWIADVLDNLHADGARPARLVAVGHGPVLEVTAEVRARGHQVDELTEREFATACGAFLTALETHDFAHASTDGDPLEKSVTGLVPRAGVVDGVAFSRRHSVGDSSAAIALAVGLWRTPVSEAPAPFIYFPESA